MFSVFIVSRLLLLLPTGDSAVKTSNSASSPAYSGHLRPSTTATTRSSRFLEAESPPPPYTVTVEGTSSAKDLQERYNLALGQKAAAAQTSPESDTAATPTPTRNSKLGIVSTRQESGSTPAAAATSATTVNKRDKSEDASEAKQTYNGDAFGCFLMAVVVILNFCALLKM